MAVPSVIYGSVCIWNLGVCGLCFVPVGDIVNAPSRPISCYVRLGWCFGVADIYPLTLDTTLQTIHTVY